MSVQSVRVFFLNFNNFFSFKFSVWSHPHPVFFNLLVCEASLFVLNYFIKSVTGDLSVLTIRYLLCLAIQLVKVTLGIK